MEISVKAYGKVLIFGAYSILEPGNIGLVVNIDKGTSATAQETQSGRIVIDMANFEIQVYGVVKDGKLELTKNPEIVKYIENAVKYAYQYLSTTGVEIRDIRLVSYNDPEFYVEKKFKTGFGSSATSTVSAVSAVLELHGISKPEIVYKIAQHAHYKSQDNVGSGYDISAACFGSQYFLSHEPPKESEFLDNLESKDYIITRQKVEWPLFFFPLIVFTGKSASTKELIKKVLKFKMNRPYQYTEFMKEYNQINLSAKQALDENWPKKIVHFLEQSWAMRKKLGKLAKVPIEPEPITLLINEMKRNGALTAGLTGAGGGDSILAICSSEENKNKLIEFLNKKKLHVFENVNIVNKGYEVLS